MCPLNPIVWYYVWHYVVINKVVLLLSKIMVTWIFGHYHICDLVIKDINHKFFMNSEF